MPDILIRMEMPKHCIDCPCMVDKYGGDNCCLQSEEANAKIESWDDMKSGCPLLELPPHGDLVDRDHADKVAVNNQPAPGWLDRLDLALMPVIVPSNKEV